MTARVEVASDVRSFLALRSVGLVAGVPMKAAAVVMLPPVVDTVGLTAPGRMGRAARVSVRVSMRMRLLKELADRGRVEGAVGLVDVGFEETHLDVHETDAGPVVELACAALPVSSVRPIPSGRFFATTLQPADVATLILAGWVPVDVIIAGKALNRAARLRGADAMAAGSLVNREIRGATELIQRTRRQLRDQIEKGAVRLGADGVLLRSGFETEWSPTRHLVEVGVVADAIAQWNERSLPINQSMPLSG